MGSDALTIVRTLDGKILAKGHTQLRDGSIETAPYDRAYEIAVAEIEVAGPIELARALERLSHEPRACVLRGRPLPDINRSRCRRLYLPHVEEDGSVTPPSFEPAARRWLALDFDGLPAPRWNADDLACRRAAIERDRAEHASEALRPKGSDDGEGYDQAADGDPAPIDPARDSELICRAAISTLPPEFADVHACWQLTASAGIKPGVHLRLWYWLDRPLGDAEAKRWLVGSSADRALYNPVQPHYTAAPIFRPRSLDPVPRRWGMWWEHITAVPVPELPEPALPMPAERRPLAAARQDGPGRRAKAYAEAIVKNVARAPDKERHPAMRSAAITLYAMAEHGLLDSGEITRSLLATAAEMNWPLRRINDLLDWCRACAAARPELPEAFR